MNIKNSIKSKLTLLIILSVITGITLNSLLIIRVTSNEFKTSTQSRLLDYVSIYEDSLSNYFNTLYTNINMNRQIRYYVTGEDSFPVASISNPPSNEMPITDVNLPALAENSPMIANNLLSTETSMDDLLENLLFSHNEALWINYCDSNGQVLNSTVASQLNTSLADESFIQDIISGQAYSISNIFNYDDTYYFYFSAGIVDDDSNLDGIICIAFPTEYLVNILSSSSTQYFMNPEDESASTMQDSNILEMHGIDSAVAYLIDGTGTIGFNTMFDDSIGYTIDSTYLSLLTTDTSENETGSNFGEYTLNGEKKYFSCISIPSSDCILMIDVLQSEINESIYTIILMSIIIAIALILVCIIITQIFASKIVKPISLTTNLLQKLAQFDFTDLSIPVENLPSDETGIMLESISIVSREFKRIILTLESFTNTLSNDSMKLSEISAQLTDTVEENSCHAEEVSAGMEETTATYHSLTDYIADIRNNTFTITESLQNNISSCKNMLNTATQLNETSIHASDSILAIYDSVKKDIGSALEGARAVSKINDMADIINNLTRQTSLLALNASIEAARAGENGKGFSVVASEISKLAAQSSCTVSDISETIKEVNASVETLKDMLIRILEFIDAKVLSDYHSFAHMSTEYSSDATQFSNEMYQMNELITSLLSTLKHMDESLTCVSKTLEASSNNVYSIAEKNTQIVEIATEANHMAQTSNNNVKHLTELVSTFKLK